MIHDYHRVIIIIIIIIKALVHTQPSIYSTATWHTYYNVYLLIAR